LNWSGIRAGFERLLEAIVLVLMAALTILVIAGATFRYLGHALSWYDELASIGLVWLTYYGSALAALRGAHIGVPSLVNAMPPKARVAAALFAEAVVLLFFILLVIYGTQVLIVLHGEHMISLPSVPTPLTQSVIPIAGTLFVVAELLGLPDKLRAARSGGFVDIELKEALEHIQQTDGPSTDTRRAP
jgi:TRAP-type C4-dicarboxylate transport system permease small subunit